MAEVEAKSVLFEDPPCLSLISFLVIPIQENLLLDEDQDLKLIDFGLCAKPKVIILNVQRVQ